MAKVRVPTLQQQQGQTASQNGQKSSGRGGGGTNARQVYTTSHGCQIWGCRMVLYSTGRIWFTAPGCPRSDSGWSRTFRVARAILHDWKLARLTSQMARLTSQVLLRCFPRLNFDWGYSTLVRNPLDLSLWQLECTFSLTVRDVMHQGSIRMVYLEYWQIHFLPGITWNFFPDSWSPMAETATHNNLRIPASWRSIQRKCIKSPKRRVKSTRWRGRERRKGKMSMSPMWMHFWELLECEKKFKTTKPWHER